MICEMIVQIELVHCIPNCHYDETLLIHNSIIILCTINSYVFQYNKNCNHSTTKVTNILTQYHHTNSTNKHYFIYYSTDLMQCHICMQVWVILLVSGNEIPHEHKWNSIWTKMLQAQVQSPSCIITNLCFCKFYQQNCWILQHSRYFCRLWSILWAYVWAHLLTYTLIYVYIMYMFKFWTWIFKPGACWPQANTHLVS